MIKDFGAFLSDIYCNILDISQQEGKSKDMRARWTDEVIKNQGVISTWTNCTVNIKLKHSNFLDNGSNYGIFFVFKKVYVFKQGNY